MRKFFFPWTAGELFDTEEAFFAWLRRKQKQFEDLRVLVLVLAAIPLVAGYVLDHRPVMLITVLPLLLVLLLTFALGRVEQALAGQTNQETE